MEFERAKCRDLVDVKTALSCCVGGHVGVLLLSAGAKNQAQDTSGENV